MKDIPAAFIGDCCVDMYKEKVGFGGSAFYGAVHATLAGAKASVVSAVGSDRFGKLFVEAFTFRKINITHLAQLPGKTSSITVKLDKNGVPSYSNWQLGVLKDFRLTSVHEAFLRRHHVAKAVFFTPLVRVFEAFCALKLQNTVKVGDFAGTSSYSRGIETIEKYIHGLDIIVKSTEKSDEQTLRFLRRVATKYNKLCLVLVGQHGSIVFDRTKEYSQPAAKLKAINTTGAGDVYISSFLITYLQTGSIHSAMRRGNTAAANFLVDPRP